MEHFRCFDSICGLDFTIDVNSPLALQIYNKYRNHVLSWYFQNNGVKLIPKVDLLPDCSDWIYDGLPHDSMLCCSTNGRAGNKWKKDELRQCFYEMESVLHPSKVLIFGTEIELETHTEIVYYETQILKRKSKFDYPTYTI